MNTQLSKKSKFFCLMMTFVMILEFFAMVNIGLIVKYAKKKTWKELAKVVIRFAKGAGVRTNAAIVAAQLAVWAVQCGMNWD